jgi:hypothetical protein
MSLPWRLRWPAPPITIRATIPRKCGRLLRETIDHVREDVEKVGEPQLKAIFETSAEVLAVWSRPSTITSRRMKPLGEADA